MKRLIYFILIFSTSPIFATQTWFVRADGGSRFDSAVTTGQCDGLADVAYPGSGTNQHCAFNDFRYMWMDGTFGNSVWIIASGDTVVIRGCTALGSQQNPDNPHCRVGQDNASNTNIFCQGISAFQGCSMPPPPNGTSGAHTKILGGCAFGTYTCNPVVGYPYVSNNLTQLFLGFNGTALMWLNGASFIDIEGLELTTHNSVCSTVGAPAFPAFCNNGPPADDFGRWGIIFTNTTSNIFLQDIYIHGFSNLGMGGPFGPSITLNRVSIDFNAFAGWNMDDGSATPDGTGATLTQNQVTFVGNGCKEQYPIVNTQFPALACWDSDSGGFGDSWSGQTTNLDSFTCDRCYVAFNTKDGAIGPHTLLKNLSLTNSKWQGNMGQQGKWGMQPNSTTVITNNEFIGNCQVMSVQLPGAAQAFDLGTGLGGSYLSLYCRASGTVFDYFSDSGSTVLINNNDFITYTDTFFDFGCGTSGACSGFSYIVKNNIFLGYTVPVNYFPGSTGNTPGIYFIDEPSVNVSASNQIEFGVRHDSTGDPCGGTIICSDPLLLSQPIQGSIPPESSLFGFNFNLTSTSPAIGTGIFISGATITDFNGKTRPNPPSIGALELTNIIGVTKGGNITLSGKITTQ
jgi:hypothetical protein